MHIVLITHYFPPEVNAPAQRAHDHSRIWASEGHQVTVVTAAPSHPYGRLYDGYENRTRVEHVDGIRVLRLKTTLGPNAGIARRAVNYGSFLLASTLNAHRVGEADVVISTSPHFLCGLAGFPVSRRSNAKWVLEVRDIWPESIIAVGAARPGMIVRALGALADWAYRTSDHIISVSPGFDAHFQARGVRQDKISRVPNGIVGDQRFESASLHEFPALTPLKGRKIAGYVGTLGMAHGVTTILDAAKRLDSRSDIGFLLVGGGAERDLIAEKARRLRLDNLVILNQMPRDQIRKLFSLIDVSIVHLKKQDVFKTVIPTKLLEGMAMGKPIALGVEGVAKEILETASAGIAFEPENADAMAATVERLCDDAKAAEIMAGNGRQHVNKHFDRQALGLKYLRILERLGMGV